MIRARFALAVTAVLTVLPATLHAQVTPQTPLPVDPQVTAGRLDNGLRYLIRPNTRPEHRAELRLVVNAGSILETDAQRGLAHMVEHMAFNGTEHFQKQELINYLESIGMQFGPSINASTSFDETVYMLRVPTDDAEVLDKAFLILEDWAHGVTFDPEEVDKERGVVIEEWRLGRGASARMADQQLPVMFKDSRYAERLPIGSVDVLESFPPEELVDFYHQWYRPDLMTVVAVGDFDPADIEGLVQSHFGGIPMPANPRERRTWDVPSHDSTYFAIATDPEATSSQVAILTIQDPPPEGTVGDYRRSLVESLASGMLNARFSELAQQSDPPFAFAGTARGRFIRTESAYQLVAVVPEDGHLRGMEAILTEAERAARHGFTQTELDRQKADLQRGMERIYNDRDNQPSSGFASEYVNHALYGEPIPGIEFEYAATQALLPGITLDEVDAVAQANLSSENRVVLVNGIDKPGLELPTESDFRQLFQRVAASDIAPYEDNAPDQPLVAEPPTPGSVVSEETIPDMDIHVWRLSNGATVWLKPTDFKEDEVVLRAVSPGGWSRSTPDEQESAQYAATLVQQGGVGDFSAIDLQKALAGKSVGVAPTIGETSEGFTGQASPKDLETLMQLVWLYFTEPRRDESTYQAFLSQGRAVLQNRAASPQAAFSDTITVTMAQHHPRVRLPTPDMLDRIDLDEAMAFYRDRFASADDFTFVLVGALDLDAVRPLVEQYLASLPAVDRQDGWVDLGIDPPTDVVEKTVRRGIEPKSQTHMAFTGPFDYTPANRLAIRSLASVLETRLRERLREDLGGTYSVGVNASYEDEPEQRYTFTIDFGSDPDRAQELEAAVFDEIHRLKNEGPTADEVATVLEQERRGLETSMEQNPWWAAQLSYVSQSGDDPHYLVDMSRMDAVTPASIQQDARLYLDEDRYVVVVLLPQAAG